MAVGLAMMVRFWNNAAGRWDAAPAPSTDPGSAWMTELVHGKAAELGATFDYLQWPPMSMTDGGTAADADGYGVFERRDFGTSARPTRYGWTESWMASVAALAAHGCLSLADLVTDALYGSNGGPGVFKYGGRAGEADPGWFMTDGTKSQPVPPFRPLDDVPGGPGSIFDFGGNNTSMQRSPEQMADAVAFLGYLKDRTGVSGWRIDNVKGQHAPGVAKLLAAQPGALAYGEYYDGNPANLNAWAAYPPIEGRCAVEDFTFHYRAQAACNSYDARKFVDGGAGYNAWRPDLSVVYLESADSASEVGPGGGIGEQVAFNKLLGYAVALALPCRLALVYAADYFPSSVWPGALGLQPFLDNIIWFSRMFAFGKMYVRWVDKDVLVLERDGDGGAVGWSGGMLVIVNFNTLEARTVEVDSTFPEGTWLHDYAGHNDDAYARAGGKVTLGCRSNYFSGGQSYGLYAVGGVDKPVSTTAREVTQTYFGNPALGGVAAVTGSFDLKERLWIRQGCRLRLTLTTPEPLPSASTLVASLYHPGASGYAATSWQRLGKHPLRVEGLAPVTGWYTATVEGFSLPETVDYRLDVTYVGAAA